MRRDLRQVVDVLDQSFWLIPAAGMVLGAVLGFVIPAVDDAFDGAVGPFSVGDRESARSLLEAIATVTVSVAGLSFSVTVVAVQLASQQLSPRVLRTFQTDRLNKATLALFLGSFAYALIVLANLGSDVRPNLSMSFGVTITVFAFGFFAAFIHNIVISLQAATVIRRIAADAKDLMANPYPSDVGGEIHDEPAARGHITRLLDGVEGEAVTATRAGYLKTIDGPALLDAARRAEAVVIQRQPLGDFVVTGAVLAEVWTTSGDSSDLRDRVGASFMVGPERTVVQDVAFPIRQLADIALRALSPSLNDPTTAENAMGSLADALVCFAANARFGMTRADEDGRARFVACAPDLDDLVRLGFEQVVAAADGYPVFARHLVGLLDAIGRAAQESGTSAPEIDRQRRRLEAIAEGG